MTLLIGDQMLLMELKAVNRKMDQMIELLKMIAEAQLLEGDNEGDDETTDTE